MLSTIGLLSASICKAQQCSLLLFLFPHFILTYPANPYPKFRTSFLSHFFWPACFQRHIWSHSTSQNFIHLQLSLLNSAPIVQTFIFYPSMSQACDGPLSPDILGSQRFCTPFLMLHTGSNCCIYAFSTVPFPLVWIKNSISLTVVGYLGTIVTQEEKLHMAT